jgi:F-type H+-transporting ATPase subunit gamma
MKRAREIRERIDNVGQIEGVVRALQALAVAHRREAERHLDAIRTHAATIAEALATVLEGGGGQMAEPESDLRGLMVVVGAAQGFGGSYADDIAEAAVTVADAREDLMIIGHRTADALAARGISPVWSADMAAHAADLPSLASRVADAAFGLLAAGRHDRMAIVNAALSSGASGPSAPQRRTLVPFDFSRFPNRAAGTPPLVTLPRAALLAGLVREYVFTELCEALAFGFAAENEARAAAMSRAQSNIRRIADDLGRDWRRARQDGMTDEITELSQRRRQ